MMKDFTIASLKSFLLIKFKNEIFMDSKVIVKYKKRISLKIKAYTVNCTVGYSPIEHSYYA